MTEQREDPARQAWKAVQDRIEAELFPLRNPVRYTSEEELYRELRSKFEKYWDPLDERYLDVASSCVMFSLRISQFNTTPYLFAYGPPDSGKSRLLDLLKLFCGTAIKSSSVSPAAIYQFLTDKHGTLLVDETDKWGIKGKAGPSERVLEIMQILNAGYRRGDYVIRANREGGKPIYYDTFGFKAGAGTQYWPPTLLERCIVLEMTENIRKVPTEISPKDLETTQGKLEMYKVVYEMGRAPGDLCQPREVDVEIDKLRDQIGDNRIAELYYGPYSVNPTKEGRAALLDLARENVVSRREAKEDSDLARVLEAVIKTWQLNRTEEIAVKEILAEYNTGELEKEQLNSQKIGWRLGKLHLHRIHKNTGSYVRLNAKALYRLARVHTPSLAGELSQSSLSSLPSQEIPLKGDNCDNSDDSSGEQRVSDPPLEPKVTYETIGEEGTREKREGE